MITLKSQDGDPTASPDTLKFQQLRPIFPRLQQPSGMNPTMSRNPISPHKRPTCPRNMVCMASTLSEPPRKGSWLNTPDLISWSIKLRSYNRRKFLLLEHLHVEFGPTKRYLYIVRVLYIQFLLTLLGRSSAREMPHAEVDDWSLWWLAVRTAISTLTQKPLQTWSWNTRWICSLHLHQITVKVPIYVVQ